MPSDMVLTSKNGVFVVTNDKTIVQGNLAQITAILDDLRLSLGKVAFYQMLAEKLSAVISRSKPWTWRYVQGVEAGTIAPSQDFARAVMALGAQIDGARAETVGTEQVQVFAQPGQVLPGSLILGETRICARPGSTTRFVPNVPWRKYCGRCPQCLEAKRK